MNRIIFLFALSIFTIGGVYFFNEPSAEAQVPVAKPDASVEKKFDAIIERVEDKVLQAEQIKPVPKVVIKYKYRTRNVPTADTCGTVTLEMDGKEIEVAPVNGRINMDSVQQQLVEQEINEAVRQDSLSRVLTDDVDEQIKGWKKLRQTINQFFKRKK